MSAKDLTGLFALGTDVEVPRLAVVRVVYGDVEGEAKREELVLGLRDLSGDSRLRVELGDDRLRLKVSNTSKQSLREYIILIWL